MSLETLRDLNPQRRHAVAGPETQAQPVKRLAGTRRGHSGGARAPHPAQAKTPACPESVGAPSAIVIEVSTGTVACQRAADKRRSIGSTTKLMTALLTLEEAKLSQTFTAADYNAAPIESKIGLQPGERMKRLRPDARAAARVRQRRRGDARRGRLGLAEGVRARDEPPRAQPRPQAHALREPDRARPGGQLLLGARPGHAGHGPADQPLLQEGRGLADGHAQDRRPPAHVHEPQPARAAAIRSSTASRPATPAAPATCSSAPPAATASSSSAPCSRTPSEAARDSDTMALFNWAFPRFQRIRPVIKGRALATAQIRYRAGAELELVASRTVRRIVLRGAARRRSRSPSTRRRSSKGRSAAASGSAASRSARAAGSSRRCR